MMFSLLFKDFSPRSRGRAPRDRRPPSNTKGFNLFLSDLRDLSGESLLWGIKDTFFRNQTKRMRVAEAQREGFWRVCAGGDAGWEKGQRLHNDSWERPGQSAPSRLILEHMF
jgi:hypothetical protein